MVTDWTRLCQLLCVASCVLFAPFGAYALEPAPVSIAETTHTLGHYLEYIEDVEGTYVFDAIRSDAFESKWEKSEREVPSFGINDSVYWFRLQLSHQSREYADLFLKIGYPLLDYVDVYIQKSDAEYIEMKLGDRLPFETRALNHPHFIVPFVSNGEALQNVFLRVETAGSMKLPMSIYTATTLSNLGFKEMMIFGLYFGVMLIMALFNLVLFIGIRDRNYLLYVIMISAYALNAANLDGISFQYLWPDSPGWANFVLAFIVGIVVVTMLLFTMSFLSTRDNLPRLHKVLVGFLSAVVLLVGSTFFLDYGTVIKPLALAVFLTTPILLIAGTLSWMSGYRPAGYYLLAWTALLTGTCLQALGYLGVVPVNVLTSHSGQIGSAIQVLLLSFALADRFNLLQEKELETRAALKHSKEMLMHSEKLANLGVMVSGIGHEIANPIGLVKMSIDLQKETLEDTEDKLMKLFPDEPDEGSQKIVNYFRGKFEELNGNVDRIGRASGRLLELSSALRSQARRDREETFDVDVNSIVEEALVITHAKMRGTSVESILDRGLPHIRCYRSRLGQVVTNLLSNAADALQEVHGQDGGLKITVATEGDERDGVAGVRVVVADNGPGVPADIREKIFEQFFTTKPAGVGTGLGLAMCSDIVKQHGGKLTVADDTALGGARFEVWVPVEGPPETEPKAMV